MATGLLSDNELLNCTICLYPYDESIRQPKLLPCHHSFCKDCLQQIAHNKSGFDCPTCRKRVALAQEGVSALQTNFYVTHMKELLSLKRPKKKVKGCKRHGNQPLSLFCEKCQIVICEVCNQSDHRESSGHVVKDINEAIDEQKRSVELEISEAQGTLLSNQSQLQSLEAEITNIYGAKDSAILHIDRTFDNFIQSLNRRRNKLKDQVTETYRSRRDGVLRQLDDARTHVVKLSTVIEQCEFAMNTGNISEVLSSRTMMRAKRSEVAHTRPIPRVSANYIRFDQHQGEERFYNCLQDLGRVLCDSMLPSIADIKPFHSTACLVSKMNLVLFNYAGDKLEYNINEECPVQVEIKDCDEHIIRNLVKYKGNGIFEVSYKPQISGDHFVRVKFKCYPIKGSDTVLKVNSNSPVAKVGKKGEQGFGEFLYPRAVAVDSNNCVYVVDTGNCCIQKFNASGEFMQQFPVCAENDAYSSCGIAFSHDGNEIVCTEVCVDAADLSAAHAVLFYTPNGQLLRRMDDPVNMKRGLCIALNSIGQVIVADFENNNLLVYDKTGCLVKKIGQNGSTAGNFNHPTFVCVGQDDRIIVSDADNNRIQVFDRDGNYMYHFGSRGTGKGKFNQPFGVGADHLGNILVVDSGNKRIQVFKQDGTFVSSIESLDDRLLAPRGITVTKDGHVWVADRDNHCIKKYKYI